MPRKVFITHNGCKVRGKYVKADGTRAEGAGTITPERAGIYKGTIYDDKPISVKPNVSGDFEVVLPPSSVLGKYHLNIAGQTFVLIVPDNRSEASLSELISE